MSELEKYIKENRQELDDIESVDIDKMWQHIGKEIGEEPVKKRVAWVVALRKIAVAASFMLIGGVGVWLFMKGDVEVEQQAQLADFYPEWVGVAEGYQKTIALKEASIPYDSLDNALFADILAELEQLEDTHKETLEDLPTVVQNERLLDAMMRYYERKIQILERISNEYKKNKRHEKREEIHI